MRDMPRTIEALQKAGRRVVIIGPVPEVGIRVIESVLMHRKRGLSDDIGPSPVDLADRQAFIWKLLDSMHRSYGVTVVYPHLLLCQHRPHCQVMVGDHSLYVDDNHLSAFGSRYISGIYDRAL